MRKIPQGACEGGGKFLLPLSVWPRRLVLAHEGEQISLPRSQALAEILGPREKAGDKMYKR